MRQASRRSWRIGQTRPVKVVFMAYRNTLQADALKLVAQKLQSSLAVEGELPKEGLAAFGDDGDDLMMALAKRIVDGEEDGAETIEEVFAMARDAEGEAEELLVDADWKTVEIEPEVAAVDGNGHHANGRHVPFIAEPAVAVVQTNGRTHPDGDGRHDEADADEQSLFSWAEFMAEPVEPKRRNGKHQPASLSMFEWAMEQERELVGAGR